jgi:hypothetical protein
MDAERKPEREAAANLDRRILELLRAAGSAWHADPGAVNGLMLEVFAHQVRWNSAYSSYAAARGARPGGLIRWQDIPPVPARAFAHLRMATFPPEAMHRRFRSSGTTGGPRAVLELDTLELYDAALLPAFSRHLLPDRASVDWIVLTPDPQQVLDSSLAYMIGSAARQLGARPRYFVAGDGKLDLASALAALQAGAAAGQPLLLIGTAIALLALVDSLAADDAAIDLPPGSRVMETGGFKGQRRRVERHTLYAAISQRLAVPVQAIVGEYGMTEMVSQFYDTTLAEAMGGGGGRSDDPAADDSRAPRLKAAPPWVRSLVVDPRTLEPVGDGEEGVLVHADLAARSSAVSLLTEDRARRSGDRFELLGRMPGAEARGCSLALDDMLRLDVKN